MAVTDTRASGFSIGHAVNMTFSVIGRNLVAFAVLTLIATLPQTLLGVYMGQAASGTNGEINPAFILSGAFWFRFVFVELVAILLGFLLQATLTYWTVLDLRGSRPAIGDALATAVGAALPLVLIGILYFFGVALGFMLLIVPGLMLITAWTVVVPAFVVERTGVMESFGRSAALTRGHRWAIFGMIVVFGIGVYVLNLATRPLFGLPVMMTKVSGLPLTYLVFQTLVRMVTSVIAATGSAAIYYELRTNKEGIGPQQLASVFE
jgi:hypothetical protein